MSRLRRFARAFMRTPLHPQWLLGRRRMPAGLADLRGAILDVGAGDRWIAAGLGPGAFYVALDYPPTGRDLYDARPDVFADAAQLPFADARFTGVVCLEVLEHVPEPGQVVAEIARVLAPQGQAWISMPFLYPLHDAPFDFQRYTEFGLRRDLLRAGLEVMELRRTSTAIRSAGLLACLALAGGVQSRSPLAATLLLLPAAMLILLTNLSAALFGCLWPDWEAMASGYEIQVRKP